MLVKNGLKCLESENSPDNYGLALFAYASILSKELIMAEKYLKELDERAITKGKIILYDIFYIYSYYLKYVS